jgi:ATP-dependent Clp protease ATP-binding subunit ClpA
VTGRFGADGGAAVVRHALEEARQRGERRLGTDHLLLGLLHDPSSSAARALGVDLEAARAAWDALDLAALAAIGLDVGGLRLGSLPPSRKRPPLTSAARAVLLRAVQEAARTKRRRPAAAHVLLALLACEPPDPAAALLAQLGVDRALVRERLSGTDH